MTPARPQRATPRPPPGASAGLAPSACPAEERPAPPAARRPRQPARGSFSESACGRAATRPGPGSSARTSSAHRSRTGSGGRGAPAPPAAPPCPPDPGFLRALPSADTISSTRRSRSSRGAPARSLRDRPKPPIRPKAASQSDPDQNTQLRLPLSIMPLCRRFPGRSGVGVEPTQPWATRPRRF